MDLKHQIKQLRFRLNQCIPSELLNEDEYKTLDEIKEIVAAINRVVDKYDENLELYRGTLGTIVFELDNCGQRLIQRYDHFMYGVLIGVVNEDRLYSLRSCFKEYEAKLEEYVVAVLEREEQCYD